MGLLTGKLGIVFGVANKRSIAWAIAQAWHKAGAKLAFTYQGESLKKRVEPLAASVGSTVILPCDVEDLASVDAVFADLVRRARRADPTTRSGVPPDIHSDRVTESLSPGWVGRSV